MKRYLLIFALLAVSFGTLWAQNGSFDVRLQLKSLNCATGKAVVSVDVRAHGSGTTFLLGDGNFRFQYDPRQIKNPTIVSQDNFSSEAPASDGNYQPQTLLGSTAGTTKGIVSLNVLYSGKNGAKSVGIDWLTVGTIQFDLVSTQSCVNLTWNTNLVFPVTGMNEVLIKTTSPFVYDTQDVLPGEIFENLQFCPAPTVTATANGQASLSACGPINLSLSATGGGSSYSWSGSNSFSSSQQAPVVSTVTTGGTYSVTVTGTSGCSASASTSVSIKAGSTLSLSSNSPVCTGQNLQLSATGDGSFTWIGSSSFSSTIQNPIRTNVGTAAAGIYSVTLSNTSGCTTSSTLSIQVTAGPCGTPAGNGQYDVRLFVKSLNCVTGKAIIQVDVRAHSSNTTFLMGDANFRFQYNPAQITNPIIATQDNFSSEAPASDGNYQAQTLLGSTVGQSTGLVSLNVLYAGKNGAKSVGTAWLTVGTIQFNLVNTQSCINLTWNTNLVFPVTGMNEVVISSSTPFSYISQQVTAGGVFENLQFCPAPIITASVNGQSTVSVCGPINLSLSATGGGVYSWAGPNGFGSSQQSPVVSSITTSGTYSITVTGTSGCSASTTVSASIKSAPSITVSNIEPVCSGQSVQLSATGGNTYSWASTGNFSSTQQSPVINTVTTASTYTVTATGTNSCTTSASTSVSLKPSPFINPTSNSPVCTGLTVSLSASGGGTYNWKGPSGFSTTSQNPNRANAVSGFGGIYSVTVTGTNNCTASATTSIQINTEPCGVAGTGQFDVRLNVKSLNCLTGKVVIQVDVRAHASNTTFLMGDANFRFQYNATKLKNPSIFSQENFSSEAPANDANYVAQTLTGSSAGTSMGLVSLNVLYSGTNGAKLVGTNWLTVGCIAFDLVNAQSCINLIWNTDLSFPVTGMNEILVSSPNPFSYSSQKVAAGGVFENLQFCPIPTVTASVVGGATIVSGSTIQLSTTVSDGVTQFNWAGPSNFTSTLQNPTRSNAQASMGGIYSVSVSTSAGCSASATVSLTVSPPNSAVVSISSNSPICLGNSLTLSATASPNGGVYSWSGPDLFTSTLQNPTQTTTATTMAGVYTVRYTATNNVTASATIIIVVNSNPIVSITSNSPTCEGGTISLSASGGTTFSWNGPSSFTSTQQNPTRTNASSAMVGVYSVSVTNSNTCSNSATISVVVNPKPSFTLIAQNTTCNGAQANNDGKLLLSGFDISDRFVIVGIVTPTSPIPTVTYANATPIPANGEIATTLPNPTNSTTYGVVVVRSTGCQNYKTAVLTPPNCLCNPKCVPFTITKIAKK